MTVRQIKVELERKQREALFAQRAELWQLASHGFHRSGRGLILADGSLGRNARTVAVRWRSGREILDGRGNTFGWVHDTAERLREYDPRNEFVLQYVSPSAAVHVYKLQAPAGSAGPQPPQTSPGAKLPKAGVGG